VGCDGLGADAAGNCLTSLILPSWAVTGQGGGLSTAGVIALVGGGAAVLGLGAYFLMRRRA